MKKCPMCQKPSMRKVRNRTGYYECKNPECFSNTLSRALESVEI
jgi:hypothetical protein